MTDASTLTEPEILGPCEPGTAVNLEGIVWHETDTGKPSDQLRVTLPAVYEQLMVTLPAVNEQLVVTLPAVCKPRKTTNSAKKDQLGTILHFHS